MYILYIVIESVLCMMSVCVSVLLSDLIPGDRQLILRQSAVPRLSTASVCYKVIATAHTVIPGNSMDTVARLFPGDISNI